MSELFHKTPEDFEGMELPDTLVPIAFLQTRIRVVVDRTVRHGGEKRTRGIEYSMTGEDFLLLKQFANELGMESAWKAFEFILTYAETFPTPEEKASYLDEPIRERIKLLRIYEALDTPETADVSFEDEINKPFNDGETWEPSVESGDENT